MTKLTANNECLGCEKLINEENIVTDFRFNIEVEDDPNTEMTPIIVHRKHIKSILKDLTNENIEDKIEETLIGKEITVNYDLSNFEENVAVSIVISKS